LGEHLDGGAAEYAVVPAENLIVRSAGMSAAVGACLGIPYVTAWQMLIRKARIEPGQTVLVQAGGSGVSIAAIQIAKLHGTTVITTVSSPEKAEKARRQGADHVIEYLKTPFREEVKRITGKRGVDVVIEHVGGPTFEESLKCLAWGGKLVTCGATAESHVSLDLKPIFFKNVEILGSTMGSKADFHTVAGLAAEGKLKPVIDQVLPFDQYAQAQARVESRKAFGKVVIAVSGKD
jgi:NADPH:quinone reductase-like Zn-dependent oxidoreductase